MQPSSFLLAECARVNLDFPEFICFIPLEGLQTASVRGLSSTIEY